MAEQGDDTPDRVAARATGATARSWRRPDITIADLIGEVDPIRVAEGRYLSDELTIHFGLIPHCNRGIFAINELPDLAERIQVGLLNILEERDVQIRGFTIRLPLDLFVVASANPEDYTSRGRIITPLKDRLGSQIRTHYPRTPRARDRDHGAGAAPLRRGRGHPDGDRAGLHVGAARRADPPRPAGAGDQPALRRVSVRVSVANLEVLRAAALKRAVRLGETSAAPRVSDLGAVMASTAGKIELESVGDESPEERIVERLITKALFTTFNRRLDVDELDDVVSAFEAGLVIETGDMVGSRSYVRWMREIPGLGDAVRRLTADDGVAAAESPAVVASAVEFVLEGLHLQRRINKERGARGGVYRR